MKTPMFQPLKSKAAMVRALSMGSVWHCQHHGLGGMAPASLGDRPVSVVQTQAVAFRTARGSDSWLHFPAKADLVFNVNGGFTVLEGGEPLMTYSPVAEG